MNMIDILETIKEDIDDEELRASVMSIDYLSHPIPKNKRTLFNHIKDRKLLESLGDILLMMLDSDEPYGGGDDFEYAINDMKRYGISAKDLYSYLEYNHQKNKKIFFQKYDTPFFIEVTYKLAESYKRDEILHVIEGK